MLTACWEQCLQMMKDTDRCGRGGGDGGRAVVSAGRLTVRLCGRVEGHGVLRNAALPGVVLRRKRVWCRKLCGDAILWGRWVLGWGVRLGHRFWGVCGLLVTLRETHNKRQVLELQLRLKFIVRCKVSTKCLIVQAAWKTCKFTSVIFSKATGESCPANQLSRGKQPSYHISARIREFLDHC